MMWTENLCYKLWSDDHYTSKESSLACKLSSVFCVFYHNSDNFILYYSSHEVNPCWLPHFGSHVTSRNQGYFSRQGRELWERGWSDPLSAFIVGPPFGANSRYLNPYNRPAFNYIKNQRVKTWLLRTCRAKIRDRSLFSKIFKKNCIRFDK